MKKQAHAHAHAPRRAPQKASATDNDSLSAWLRHLFKGLLVGLGVGLGLLTVASLILYFTPDPSGFALPVSLLISALTAAAGGFATVKFHRHAALLCGLFQGSLCMALMLLLSLFFKDSATGYQAWISCLLHLGFLLCSVAGAFLGLRPKKHRRH